MQSEPSGFNTMASSIEFADNYHTWILQKFSPYIQGNVLEVGTGQGNFKRYLISYSIEYYMSIDIDEEVIRQAKERNPQGHYQVADVAGNNFASAFSWKFDAVLMCNVLENDMDKMAGHYRRYVRKDLKQIVEKVGGKLLMNEYFNPIGGLGWYANKFMTHKDLDSPAINKQIRFFDKNIVPISKGVNPLTQSFFGQSVISVIQNQ